MEKSLVSIMMPVMNGELFLPQALESLLAQDYGKFELIILDNLSTDRTPEICQGYAARDRRVRYVRDDQNRITHDAANHLATFVRGEYCVYACDDDLWAPTFLSRLVGVLEENPDVALAFANAAYVEIDGRKGRQRLLKGRALYHRRHARFWNVWHFLRRRRVVPVFFGVYRTSALAATLPFDTFDETIADVDSLFMVKLLSRHRVDGVDEVLFWYRNKYRGVVPEMWENYPKSRSALAAWLYRVSHQKRFLVKTLDALDGADVGFFEKGLLKVRAVYAFLLYISLLQLRPALGRLLVAAGLREGPPARPDVYHEIRVRSHRDIDFRTLTAAKNPPSKRALDAK